jgi:hypothetical protein
MKDPVLLASLDEAVRDFLRDFGGEISEADEQKIRQAVVEKVRARPPCFLALQAHDCLMCVLRSERPSWRRRPKSTRGSVRLSSITSNGSSKRLASHPNESVARRAVHPGRRHRPQQSSLSRRRHRRGRRSRAYTRASRAVVGIEAVVTVASEAHGTRSSSGSRRRRRRRSRSAST